MGLELSHNWENMRHPELRKTLQQERGFINASAMTTSLTMKLVIADALMTPHTCCVFFFVIEGGPCFWNCVIISSEAVFVVGSWGWSLAGD
jgi:hypothetical protein